MIFIIIPVFNRKEFTKQCLISLRNQSYPFYKVIIVDDGSTDGTKEMIVDEFPEVIRLAGDGNLWWTGATNMGIKYVFEFENVQDEGFILTLNNDLEVEPNYIENLLNVYKQNKPCLVGSICIDFENRNRIEDLGCKWNRFTAKLMNNVKEYGDNYETLMKHNVNFVESDMLSGRGVLIPMKIFDENGYFDEKTFPQYAADNDFSLRAKNIGYKLLISVYSPVYAHLKETGDDFKRKIQYNVFLKSLFSIKSSTNIKTRYYFAIKHSPIKIIFFFIDMARVIVSFHILFIKKYFK